MLDFEKILCFMRNATFMYVLYTVITLQIALLHNNYFTICVMLKPFSFHISLRREYAATYIGCILRPSFSSHAVSSPSFSRPSISSPSFSSLALSTPAISSVSYWQSVIFHPYDFVCHLPVLHFPPPAFMIVRHFPVLQIQVTQIQFTCNILYCCLISLVMFRVKCLFGHLIFSFANPPICECYRCP